MDLFFEDDQAVGSNKKNQRNNAHGRACHVLDLGSTLTGNRGQSKQGEQQR
jgi:hypothetical protein